MTADYLLEVRVSLAQGAVKEKGIYGNFKVLQATQVSGFKLIPPLYIYLWLGNMMKIIKYLLKSSAVPSFAPFLFSICEVSGNPSVRVDDKHVATPNLGSWTSLFSKV